jgi:Na+/H+ antiporter NhaD/arsenite permease-like protein
MNEVFLAGGIFVITYALIVSERVDRTVAALMGGFLMILLGVVDQETAFHAVDFNVIFLLAGMMVIAYILSETGVFQWLAIQAVILGNRNPYRILVLLSLMTAIGSAALDNVTVVVLIAPVTLFVANNLGISPIPFLIAEVMASNIGGAATLIGDPPNILIGSAANIDFVTFFVNMIVPVTISLILFIPLSYFVFRNDLRTEQGSRPRVAELEGMITDPPLLRKSLIVIAGVLLGFIFHGTLHLEPATIAMFGATILMLWTRKESHEVFHHVEWNTLMFFVGLFIAVEAIVEVGIIEMIANAALNLTGGNLALTTMLVLWLSAIASGIVDNIPFTATMIPLIRSLGASGMSTEPLWFSLALGADFGGNYTLVGASANVVVASIAERSGYRITFGLFTRKSFLITTTTLIVASIYVWFRWL